MLIVSAVFPDTRQLICHYHFVKDLGKDAFSTYEELRAAMVSTKALAKISSVTMPDKGTGIAYAEELWVAIASEYILFPRTIPSKYPFLLPYFQVMERCIEIEGMLKSIVSWNASHMKIVKAVMNIHGAVGKITHESEVLERYRIIVRVWAWFESVRKALRVSRDLNSGEAPEAPDIGIIGSDLNSALSRIMKEGEFAGGDLERISRIFENRIEDHRAELLSRDGKGWQYHRYSEAQRNRGDWPSMEQDAHPAQNRKVRDIQGDGNVRCPHRHTLQPGE